MNPLLRWYWDEKIVCPASPNPPIPSLIPNTTTTKMPQHGSLHPSLDSSKIQIIFAENCTNFKDKASDRTKDETWSNGPALGLFWSHEHFQLRQPSCLKVSQVITYLLWYCLMSIVQPSWLKKISNQFFIYFFRRRIADELPRVRGEQGGIRRETWNLNSLKIGKNTNSNFWEVWNHQSPI